MAKFICNVCGYEYDEAAGDPDNGIAPGTKWEDVPKRETRLISRMRKLNANMMKSSANF